MRERLVEDVGRMSPPVPWSARLALLVVSLLLLSSLFLLLVWLPSLWDAVRKGPALDSHSLSATTGSMIPGPTAVQIPIAHAADVRGVVTLRMSVQRDCHAGCPV